MKYAQFDSTATQPTPVIGWYHVFDAANDPSGFKYPNLPAAADLLEITDLQWASRFDTPYVDSGALVSVPSSVQVTEQAAAKNAELQAAYTSAIYADISFTTAAGVTATFQADAASQQLMVSVLAGYTAIGSVPSGFFWQAVDNSQPAFTLADLQGLVEAILNRGQPLFVQLQKDKASVRSIVSNGTYTDATKITKIQAITF